MRKVDTERSKIVQSEKTLYRTIFENTGTTTIIVEEDMTISMVNKECEKLLGYSREEIVGIKRWDDLIAEEEADRLREYHNLRRIDPDAVPKSYQTKLVDRTGRIKNVSITADLIPGTKKSVVSILDITKHKSAEEALRKSEGKYRTLIENVNIGIYRNTGGPYGQFLQANPTMVKMFGYSSAKKFMKVFTSELYQDPEERKIFVDKIQKQGFVKDEKLKLRKKDGTFFWGSVTAKAQYDKDGEIRWIDGVIEDITERKRIEERLVQSLEALQSVYRIATTMRDSYQAVCDQVVYNLSKLLRVSYVAVQHVKEDRMEIISSITDSKITHNEEVFWEHSPCATILNGKNEPCQTTGSLAEIFPGNKFITLNKFKTHVGVPIKSIGGKVAGLICAMDHADRIFTDDEIRLIEIFARYVAYEFERNIMEIQLRQLDRMKLLGQMAAGVAHEVRNPLNAILAISEALFQDIGDKPGYKPFLKHIRIQVDRLSRLMGDLLDLGKPIQMSSLHRESLPAVSTAAMDLWRQMPLSRTHEVKLIMPPERGDLDVMADSSRLQQVFLNLLENAAQHSPEESAIQFVISTPKMTTARICIIDQGTGVDAENFEKVFEPFFTTRKKGNGLGLSIAKNTIEALGGDIMIRNNRPAPGCTVEITLPIVHGVEP
jgi:PAS domain S-box-containing protein